MVCGLVVDPAQDLDCFLVAALVHQMTGRLRTPGQQAAQHNRRHASQSDHVSPSMRNGSKSSPQCIGDDLAHGDRSVVQPDQASSGLCWCQFGHIQRDNHGSRAHSETDDETSHGHLGNGVRGTLQDGADGEEDTSEIYGAFTAGLVSSQDGVGYIGMSKQAHTLSAVRPAQMAPKKAPAEHRQVIISFSLSFNSLPSRASWI